MSLVALSLQEQASSDRKQGYGGKKNCNLCTTGGTEARVGTEEHCIC